MCEIYAYYLKAIAASELRNNLELILLDRLILQIHSKYNRSMKSTMFYSIRRLALECSSSVPATELHMRAALLDARADDVGGGCR